jgi:hypothetical protein
MIRLIQVPLAPADLDRPEVQQFYCGQERWEREVADWIKSRTGDNSVLEDMKQFDTKVWLYWTERGDLVGYSSLGENTWSLPLPKGPKQLISYIPFIGIQQHFQRQPADVGRDGKFAYRILDDLIERVADKTVLRPDLQPFIGLSVDQDNKKAIKFYENRNFANTNCPKKDKNTGVVYDRMVLNIATIVATRTTSPPQL